MTKSHYDIWHGTIGLRDRALFFGVKGMAKRTAKGVSAHVALDRTSAEPVYKQIAAGLRAAIGRRDLLPGERLASTRALSKDWGVSRNTLLQVFEELTSEGYLVSRVGDGTYVADEVLGQSIQTPAETNPQLRQDFPFRTLSRRGRSLVGQLSEGLSERPAPFMPDVPDHREFPMRAWLRMMNEVSGRLGATPGTEMSAAGFYPLRQAIAHHLTTSRGLSCDAEQVIVTSGSQQGLDLVSRLLVDRGEPVWMEEPGYVGARAALRANGCNVLAAPVDKEGLDVSFAHENLLAPRLICVTPARHYPTGAMMSLERRRALLDHASRTGAWVVEDDYDGDTFYEGPPPAALSNEDSAGRVIFIGTFSKTLLPSLRLGYVVAPQDLAQAFARARAVTDRHAPILEQLVLTEMMHRGLYAAHLRRMRVLYRERQQALIAALRDVFGDALDAWPSPEEQCSGMHLMLPLHDGVDDQAAARTLLERGVVARPLSIYYARPRKQRGLLLGFAAFNTEAIQAAAPKLSPLQSALA
ncbi:MAG: PLP-dependent aminotransferase family protein [Pseudomonadota bacterium]